MGTSTNAILFYGYCWDDEEVSITSLLFPDFDEEVEETNDLEWQELIAIKRGFQNPWKNYPNAEIESLPYEERRAATKRWTDDHQGELDEWYELKRAIDSEFGIEISTHCSSECAMPYVYVVESEITAIRGTPEELNLGVFTGQLDLGKDWDGKMQRFINELGIITPEAQHHPRWWLVSDWSW